jgi:hypothetical protein
MAQTFIYAIHCPNKNEVKIGYATNPTSRLSQLQVGTTDRLDLLITFAGGLAEEKEIHKALAKHKISGEWFKYSPEVFSVLIDAMANQFPIARTTANPKVVKQLERRLALSLEYIDELLQERLERLNTIKEVQELMKESFSDCRHLVSGMLNVPEVFSELTDSEFVAVLQKYSELINRDN